MLTSLTVSQSFNISAEMRDICGWFLVSLLAIFMIFNFAILIYDACKILRLHCIRRRKILKYRDERCSVEKLNEITLKALPVLKEEMLRNNVKTAKTSGLKISNQNEASLSDVIRPNLNLIQQKSEQTKMPF